MGIWGIENGMFRHLRQYIYKQRTKRLKEWLHGKYEPSIRYYNESDRFDPLSHLLIDLGETYMGILYSEEIRKKFRVSEDVFERASKEVYDDLFRSYSDFEDVEDSSLYIR